MSSNVDLEHENRVAHTPPMQRRNGFCDWFRRMGNHIQQGVTYFMKVWNFQTRTITGSGRVLELYSDISYRIIQRTQLFLRVHGNKIKCASIECCMAGCCMAGDTKGILLLSFRLINITVKTNLIYNDSMTIATISPHFADLSTTAVEKMT